MKEGNKTKKRETLALVPVLALLNVLVLPTPVRSQEPQPLARLNSPVVIDGRVDEAAWESVPILPLIQHAPQYLAKPSEETEIRVAYDNEFIYMSGRMYDSKPHSVRANTLYRDAFAGDDLVSILLDTYNDRQSATWLCINSAGNRIDQITSHDGAALNIDWNTYWDAETSHDERGWYAEMRIPFSSLGFQDMNGRVVMGLQVYRFIGRTNERLIYPDIPPTAGSFTKPSLFQRIVLEGVHRRQPVYVAPYALGGWRRNAVLNSGATGFAMTQASTREAGLDVRNSPSPNFSLDFTANTDFAQVEVDDQQINLTRFPLFLPEKRQFFQERSSIFDFGLGGFYSRLFHSRRIGLVEGQPIRLLGGLRLVGRLRGTDVGFLNMQTAADFGQPSENFGVVRLRQRMFNENSTVGGMVTTRMGNDGSYNVAAGADAVLRVVGDDYATLKFAHTFENDVSSAELLDASRMLLRWERRSEGGFAYAAEATRSGAAFNPGVGFDLRSDFTSFDGQLQYLWFTGPMSPFRRVAVEGAAQGFRRNAEGSTESAILSPALRAEFKNGSYLGFTYRTNYESVQHNFPLAPDVAVPAGDYWFREGEIAYMASATTVFQPSLSVTAGDFYGGRRVALTANPAWNPSRHLEVGADYSFNAIRFPDRDQSLDVHLLRLRVRIAYDTHLSFSTFWQYNSVEDVASLNARLRYNVRDGCDLWIVYNEAINTDRYTLTPVPPVSQGKAVMIKYTHTLLW